MEKLSFEDAIIMTGKGFYMMHLEWLNYYEPDIIKNNPDCSHFIVQAGQNWRDISHRVALVLKQEDVPDEPRIYTEIVMKTLDIDGEDYNSAVEHTKRLKELYIQNRLLIKAFRTYIHETGSPLGTFRNRIPILTYWLESDKISAEEKEEIVLKNCGDIVKALDVLVEFRKKITELLDFQNPPDNEKIEEIIQELEKIL